MTHQLNFDLKKMLACPVCKSGLHFLPKLLKCTECGLELPQSSHNGCDLLPNHLLERDQTQWQKRQLMMEYWYKGLLANPQEAIYCFNHDYKLFQPLLATLTGLILDIGGGNGIARHFLPDAVRYVSLDPSLDWLTMDWSKLAGDFPCLKTPPFFINGLGEYLPFQAHTFDGVLVLWSLNHVQHPDKVIKEVYKVLRPGGRCFIVIEDMEPKWLDLNYYRHCYKRNGRTEFWKTLKLKFECKFGNRKWPLEEDHIRIQEKDLYKWAVKNFRIRRREWINQYLTLELIRD